MTEINPITRVEQMPRVIEMRGHIAMLTLGATGLHNKLYWCCYQGTGKNWEDVYFYHEADTFLEAAQGCYQELTESGLA